MEVTSQAFKNYDHPKESKADCISKVKKHKPYYTLVVYQHKTLEMNLEYEYITQIVYTSIKQTIEYNRQSGDHIPNRKGNALTASENQYTVMLYSKI